MHFDSVLAADEIKASPHLHHTPDTDPNPNSNPNPKPDPNPNPNPNPDPNPLILTLTTALYRPGWHLYVTTLSPH